MFTTHNNEDNLLFSFLQSFAKLSMINPGGQTHFPSASHVMSGTPGKFFFGHEHSVSY